MGYCPLSFRMWARKQDIANWGWLGSRVDSVTPSEGTLWANAEWKSYFSRDCPGAEEPNSQIEWKVVRVYVTPTRAQWHKVGFWVRTHMWTCWAGPPYDTWYSQRVTHLDNDQAWHCLTSVILWEPLCPVQFGKSSQWEDRNWSSSIDL